MVLHTDGTWECVEDIVSFQQVKDGVRLILDDGSQQACENIAMIIIQPK